MVKKINKRKELVINTTIVIILVVCECFFLRNIIFSSNGALIGDRGDARLAMLTTEHWWNFFCGKEGFFEIAMYYPSKAVMGFTDLFLGFGLIHSLFRLFGIDMLLSYQLTLITIHFIGTLSMFYLLKKKIKCNNLWSLFGTISFSFSSSYLLHLNHNQIDAFAFMPLILIFVYGFIENFENRKKRNIYAYISITLFVLLAYTSWYMACFTGLFVLIGLIVFVIKSPKQKLKNNIVILFKNNYKDFILYLVFTIILFIPFIYIYLLALLENGGYGYAEATGSMVRVYEIINAPLDNLLMGWIHKVFPNYFSENYELIEGFSVVLLLLFVISMITNIKNKKENDTYERTISSTIYITIIICVLLTVRVRGYTFWYFVYHFIPVMKGIRVVPRFLLYLSFPMALITSYVSNKYIVFKDKKYNVCFVIIMTILAFISNINLDGVPSRWNIQDEEKFINGVSAPPENAEVFFLVNTTKEGYENYEYQLDAFEIADKFSIKTLNGYSGQSPVENRQIGWVFSDEYNNNVITLIAKYNMKNVYAYDYVNNVWIPSSTYFNSTK